jgi:hypothetical protein
MKSVESLLVMYKHFYFKWRNNKWYSSKFVVKLVTINESKKLHKYTRINNWNIFHILPILMKTYTHVDNVYHSVKKIKKILKNEKARSIMIEKFWIVSQRK